MKDCGKDSIPLNITFIYSLYRRKNIKTHRAKDFKTKNHERNNIFRIIQIQLKCPALPLKLKKKISNFEVEKNIFLKKNFLAYVPPGTQVFPQRVSAHSVQTLGYL